MTIGSSTTLFICSALALIIQFSDCGRVLVYSPSISFSHLISNGRIADALAEAGHEVVSLSSIFNSLKRTRTFLFKPFFRFRHQFDQYGFHIVGIKCFEMEERPMNNEPDYTQNDDLQVKKTFR